LDRRSSGSGATGRSSGLVRMHYDVRARCARLAELPVFSNWQERVGGDCGLSNRFLTSMSLIIVRASGRMLPCIRDLGFAPR
jgi:hypothetical protein